MSVIKKKVDNINGYLLTTKHIKVVQEKASLFNLPTMFAGGASYCGGFLLLDFEEKVTLLKDYPECKPYIKRYIGAKEILRGELRYCIRVEKDTSKAVLEVILEIPPFKTAFGKVKAFREGCKKLTTKKFSEKPYLFVESFPYKRKDGIFIPKTSSESRDYLPVDLFDKDAVPSNGVFGIYDYEDWLFSVLSSHMHMIWVKTVSGKMEGDIRYSNTLVYNTFPVPELNDEEKGLLSYYAKCIIEERESLGGTLGELYNPKTMPNSLLKIHKELDNYLDELYMKESEVQTLGSDEDRLSMLFNIYQKRKGELQ